MQTYRSLTVYQQAYRLALDIHKLSLRLPHYLQYDLANQMRRCSRSVPSNIAEGYSSYQSKRDIIRFLRIARGSNEELLFNLQFCLDSHFIATHEHDILAVRVVGVSKQLNRLITYLVGLVD